MNRVVGIALVGGALAATLTLASAMPEISQPASVDPESWIGLGPDAGFVITDPSARGARGENAASIRGYFVARRNGKWMRLNAEAEPQALPVR